MQSQTTLKIFVAALVSLVAANSIVFAEAPSNAAKTEQDFIAQAVRRGSVPFQKSKGKGSLGYQILESPDPRTFRVHVNIGKNDGSKQFQEFRVCYFQRAIGTRCQELGYDFIDLVNVSETEQVGFCFKTEKKNSLAILFAQSGLDKTPAEFEVQDLNNKKNSLVRVGDKIIAANGKKLTSLADLKKSIFQSKEGDTYKLEILRQGQKIEVNEPLVAYEGLMPAISHLMALACP